MLTSFMLITALLLAEAQRPRKAAADAERPVPGVSDAEARAALEIEVDRLTSESQNLEKRLTDSEARRKDVQDRHQQLARTLAQEEKRRRQAERDADEAVAAASAAREDAEAAEATRGKAIAHAIALEEALTAVEEAAEAAKAQAQSSSAEAKEEARTAQEAAEEAERQAQAYRQELERMQAQGTGTTQRTGSRRQKGINPPCWYTAVSQRDGTIREKPLYLLDIAIHDRHIVLGRRTPPPGGPDDEKGSYASEFQQVGAHRLPYGKRLTDAEVRAALTGIRQAGKEARIRSYPCISYAQVWDRTGATSKQRWRNAHESLVQQYLGTYVVQDPRSTPWPH